MKIVSICESSARVRSPTPVPASISTSLSTRNEVVRRCRPPIPPEQPRTRNRMGLLVVEHGDRLPRRGHWRAAGLSDFVGIKPVETALWIGAVQLGETGLCSVPVARAIGAQHMVPEAHFVLHGGVNCGCGTERFVDRDGLLLSLHLDA